MDEVSNELSFAQILRARTEINFAIIEEKIFRPIETIGRTKKNAMTNTRIECLSHPRKYLSESFLIRPANNRI